MPTWVSSPVGSARHPCRRLLWTGTHLWSQLGHRQNPILALQHHNPTSWGKSALPILAWSDRFEKWGITYKQQKHLPYSTHCHRWGARQDKHYPLSPSHRQAWDYRLSWAVLKKYGKVHSKVILNRGYLRCWHWCGPGSNPSERPHCSSFRPHLRCSFGSCNLPPTIIRFLFCPSLMFTLFAFTLFHRPSVTSSTPIRRGCAPFSSMSGPPESPLHASVTIPSVTEAVYNHSLSTWTYLDQLRLLTPQFSWDMI